MKKGQRIVDKMMPDARRIFDTYNFKITEKPKDGGTLEKYTVQKFLTVYSDYNAFENLIIVRTYVQKRFKLGVNMLEVLLYLAPKHYFTVVDLGSLPKDFRYCGIDKFLKTGYASVFQVGKNKGDSIYTISGKGWKVVKMFYKLLAGEEQIPVDKRRNPLNTEEIAWDRKRMKLIEQLNKMPVPDNKRKLFE